MNYEASKIWSNESAELADSETGEISQENKKRNQNCVN